MNESEAATPETTSRSGDGSAAEELSEARRSLVGSLVAEAEKLTRRAESGGLEEGDLERVIELEKALWAIEFGAEPAPAFDLYVCNSCGELLEIPRSR